MPIYEYECKDCRARFDALRSMKDADVPIDCPMCKNQNTSRQISACFAHSGGRVIAGSAASDGCAGCAGGSCASCGH